MAVDWNKLKTRYLQDDVPTRLGGIASNLARIKSLARSGSNEQIAEHLIRESQFLIEWTAPGTDLKIAAELVELQQLLSYWHYHWSLLWSTPGERLEVAEQAQVWSDRILKYSGLLTR